MLSSIRFYHFNYVPPLFWITVFFISGLISYALFFSLVLSFTIGILITIWVLTLLFYKKKNIRHLYFLLAGTAFCLGALRYKMIVQEYLQCQMVIEEKRIDLKGNIADINIIDHPRFKQCATLLVQSACDHNGLLIKGMRGKNVQIYSTKKSDLTIDDEIVLEKIRIKKPQSSSIELYLQKEKAVGSIVYDLSSATLLHRPSISISRWIHKQKMGVFSALKNKMSTDTFTFFSAFFLGNRKINKKENDKLKNSCKNWGISHYLARSGLHLVVFIMVWEYLLRAIPLAFIIKQLILLILTIIYFLLTWNSISFLRAFITFIFYKIFLLSSAPSHTIHTVTLVCLIVLFVNPLHLFFLDFQLSFGITLLLSWVNQHKLYRKRILMQNA